MEDPFDSLKDFVCDDDTDHTPWSHPDPLLAPVLPPWTPERHAAHRERMMGNKLNEGKPLSQETKDKISAAKTGRPAKREHILARTGRNLKPDHKMTKHGLYCRKWRQKQRELGKLGKLAQRTTDDAQ